MSLFTPVISPLRIARSAGRRWAALTLVGIVPSFGAPAFHRLVLSGDFLAEGAAFGDLNRDGHLDAVAGPYWYAGPAFTARHELYAPQAFPPRGYSDNFSAFVHDFNGDRWPDVLVIGFPGQAAFWFENPGERSSPWSRHPAFAEVDTESPTFGDLLGTGQPVLICASGGRLGYAAPDSAQPHAPWTFHAVTPPGPWQRYTHGLGFGDVNGDGRPDLLEQGGWWQQPASPTAPSVWTRHPQSLGSGAQIHATDLNADGRADLVTSLNAHGYGLAWFEQLPANAAAAPSPFLQHTILPAEPDPAWSGPQFSQLHAVALADIDGDGLDDIVTGKRWWAHGPDKDPEPNAPPLLCAFLRRRSAAGDVSFEPLVIDDDSGVGTQIATADANRDGRADVLVSNKRGTFLFLSQPAGPSGPPLAP